MDECLYFSRRSLGETGQAVAWVKKIDCPECGKAKMGKLVDKGKIKTRAEIYVCPACGYSEEKIAHEESLQLEAQYTCSKCGKDGQSSALYKRKNYLEVPSFVVDCQHCGEKIPLTKKMKKIKKKGKGGEVKVDEEEI